MPRGRPVRSEIRQNIIELLNVTGPQYGYQIHKFYNELFPVCTRENIYYNLRKGVAIGEFVLSEIKQEKGAFSWGTIVEKKYYKLGPNASPKGSPRVNDFFASLKSQKS